MPTSLRPSRRELQEKWPAKAPDYRNKRVTGAPSAQGGYERSRRQTRARHRGVPHVSTATREDY